MASAPVVASSSAFTKENLVEAVKGLGDKWEWLGTKLCVPQTELKKIQKKETLPDKLSAMFEYVLEMNPYASWRSVVQELDRMKEHEMAKGLKPFIKPVSDPTLTLESVHDVVSVTKRDWDEAPGLADLLQVPFSIQKDIQRRYYPAQAQKDKVMEYWLTTSPSASWETLAGVLYRLKEEDALERVKTKFLKVEDSTLIVENLRTVFRPLYDNDVSNLQLHLGLGQSPLDTSLETYLKSHPAPSWRGVAWALYTMGGGTVSAHKAIKIIYEKGFLKRGSGYEREESVKKPVPAGNFDNAMTSDQFFSWLTDKGISSGDIQVLKAQNITSKVFPKLREKYLDGMSGLSAGGRLAVHELILQLHAHDSDLLQDLRRATRDARAEWKNIGMELGLSPGDIAAIQIDHPNSSEDQFSKMLEEWSHRWPSSEWVDRLAKALASEIVGRDDLAGEVRKKQRVI